MTRKERDAFILQRLESFQALERKDTDETGAIALALSCTRSRAAELIEGARARAAGLALPLRPPAPRTPATWTRLFRVGAGPNPELHELYVIETAKEYRASGEGSTPYARSVRGRIPKETMTYSWERWYVSAEEAIASYLKELVDMKATAERVLELYPTKVEAALKLREALRGPRPAELGGPGLDVQTEARP